MKKESLTYKKKKNKSWALENEGWGRFAQGCKEVMIPKKV